MPKKFIAFLVFVLVSLMVLPACGPKKETPEQAVKKALNAIRDLDTSTMEKYFPYKDLMDSEVEELGDDEEYVKLLFRHLSYKVIAGSVNGDRATVKVDITNIDLDAVMAEYFRQSLEFAFSDANSGSPLSEEEAEKFYEQLLVNLLKKDDPELTTSTVVIALKKNGASWTIEIDDEFRDAILGGMSTTEDTE